MSSFSSKKISKLPLYIVEDHNDALNFILRGIGSKCINFNENLLIHFDSHPDLLINNNLTPTDVFDKETLLEKVSIETWISPLLFAGHVSTVVWIKPEWSNQIEDGIYTFYIGSNQEEEIMVSSPLLYFISALNYNPDENLINCKKVTLHVLTLNNSPEKFERCKAQLLKLIECNSNNYLLDIDLDFFSTLNPFIEMYPKAKMYERLKSIYKFEEVNISAIGSHMKRKAQIDSLEQVFINVASIEGVENRIKNIDAAVSVMMGSESYNGVKELIIDLCQKYGDDVDWEMVHNAGTTIDDLHRELPHHPSSKDEIVSYLSEFQQMMQALSSPKLITVARSSLDDYCPPDVVDFIQENVCQTLSKIFNPNIQKHF